MNRIKSGILGLDKLIQGGIPCRSSVLVCGGPGTGKSIFGLQFLYQGAMNGENGLYVTIEEKPINLKQQARQFGMDFNRFNSRINFLKIPVDMSNFDIFSAIRSASRKVKAKRIVIDSLSIMAINASMYKLPVKVRTRTKWEIHELQPSSLGGEFEMQQFIYILISRIMGLGATCLFISDSAPGTRYLTRDSVSEFACDSVLQLKMMEMGKTVYRTLQVRKMRKTNIEPGLQMMHFGRRGMHISGFEY
ncbi:hypothetical protein JW968_00875 [Candidatus Woesearchaeota archaeon]|nr:hypothetical protein [Candidatus Woesearchaeota archaeon]